MFSAMPLASIVDPGYKIALFLHVLAVVLAFGPTFGYGFFFSVVPKYPRAAPAIISGIQKCDRYLVGPGMLVVLAAAIYMQIDGDWDTNEAFISVGFLAWALLLALQNAFFTPQVRKAKELAERDLKSGDTLSEEFQQLGQRIGKVGTLAGLVGAITIFFMTYKPFL
jgi:tetrahydromethanopterin S-methyltransferase subunit G